MRRLVIAAGALALVAGASFTASADAPTRVLPKAGCNLFTDPAGDARLQNDVTVTGPAPAPPVTVPVGAQTYDSTLDITGVSYRLSGSTFSTVIRVPGLKDRAGRGPGDWWKSTFTINKHIVIVSGTRVSPTPAIDPLYTRAYYLDSVSIDGATVGSIPTSGEFDPARGLVTISVSRSGLEKAVAASLDTELTAVTVTSAVRVTQVSSTHDTAAPPKTLVVNPADNGCFV